MKNAICSLVSGGLCISSCKMLTSSWLLVSSNSSSLCLVDGVKILAWIALSILLMPFSVSASCFFQKGQVGAFSFLQFHKRINQPFHDFIIHNRFHGIVDNQIFNPVFLDSFLIAEFLFLGIHTAIIVVYFHRMACAAFPGIPSSLTTSR